MTSVNCSHCGNPSVEMNKSLSIQGENLCFTCVDVLYEDRSKLEGKFVMHKLDPTVCSFCEKDFGDEILAWIGKRPVCDPCAQDIRNRTFPLWVKGFLAFVLLAVVFSSIWNFHYYRAWYSLQQSHQAFEKGDAEGAYLMAQEASENASDVPDLGDLASYYHGIFLMTKDSSRQALSEFRKCAATMGDYTPFWVTSAQLNVDFENKDYKSAIKTATSLKDFDSTGAAPFLRIASAYSCQYAVSGMDSMKTAAISNLEKAKKQGFEDGDSLYANMIRYRLATKDPIERETFEKKYPKGWTQTN